MLASATVWLNGIAVANVTTLDPAADVWLDDGNNTVVVQISKKTADSYTFNVQPDMCALPDTSGNTFSADGIYDPIRFELTDSAGTRYLLDRRDGLIQMTDRNGNASNPRLTPSSLRGTCVRV